MVKYGGTAIRAAARRAGFSDRPIPGRSDNYTPSDIIAAIALAESGGDTNATASTSREYSVGVYQINLMAHGQNISEAEARDLDTASVYAHTLVYNTPKSWDHWSVYKSGRYLDFLPLTGEAESDPVGSGGQPGASPVADAPGEVLGIPLPTREEVRRAATAAAVATLAILLLIVGVQGLARGAAEPVARAVISGKTGGLIGGEGTDE